MNRSNPTEKGSEQYAGQQNSAPGAHRDSATLRGEIFDFDPSHPNAMNNASSPRYGFKVMLLVGLAAALCIYGLGAFVQSKSKTPAPVGPFTDPSSVSPTFKVQVLGAVKKPGVYEVPSDARVQDVIKAAGGALPDADLSHLNLADWAKDGSKIEVPQVNKTPVVSPTVVSAPVVTTPVVAAAPLVPAPSAPETQPAAPLPEPAVVAAPPVAPPLPSTPVVAATPAALLNDGVPRATLPSGATSVNASIEYLKQNPLDLNQATAAQLESLPGVGDKMAARIIAYRTQNGGFRSVSDLDNVAGIGEKRLALLRQLVVVR